MVSILTDDPLLTMPPQPLEYEGHEAITASLSQREEERGAPLRVVPTRANTQRPSPPICGADRIGRPRGLFVLTLAGEAATAITWFTGPGCSASSVFSDAALVRRSDAPECRASGTMALADCNRGG